MNAPESFFPVDEMVVYDPLDPKTFVAIEECLMGLKDSNLGSAVAASFDANQTLIGATEGAPIDGLREMSQRMQDAQRSRGGLIGKTTVHAALFLPSNMLLEPWHSENFSAAYAASSLAATEGVMGEIRAASQRQVPAALLYAALVNTDFEHIPTLRIVRPAVGSLIHLPIGAVHSSPRVTGTRVHMNGTIQPNFMKTIFG